MNPVAASGRESSRFADYFIGVVVTGSAGHLGEALMRTFRACERPAVGLDIKSSPYTDVVGSITDRELLCQALVGVSSVIHAATLHKPHLATHTDEQFVHTNVSGTLVLLEEALAAGVQCFVYTSTTSAFGSALTPPPGEPAAWVTEEVAPVPKNIYGVSKTTAESLCEMFAPSGSAGHRAANVTVLSGGRRRSGAPIGVQPGEPASE